jgi:hypothetical protein
MGDAGRAGGVIATSGISADPRVASMTVATAMLTM